MCNCYKNRRPTGAASQSQATSESQAVVNRVQEQQAAAAPSGSAQRPVSTTFALQTPAGTVRGSRLEVQAARIRQGGSIQRQNR